MNKKEFENEKTNEWELYDISRRKIFVFCFLSDIGIGIVQVGTTDGEAVYSEKKINRVQLLFTFMML